jgi:hypothetical protein
LLAESWVESGAVAPPPLSVVVPVLPVGVLVALGVVESDDDVLSLLVLSLDVLLSLLELSRFADAASVGAVSDCGTETSAGGPGTSGAPLSPPPQPAAARASRPAATSAMMRPDMWLTPP